jgi:inosine-uridine nucleoside N-ribohydrolase
VGAQFDEHNIAICDSSAAAALLLDGDCLETEDYYVVCETQSTENEGQTVFDYKGHLKGQANVQLCMKLDREKYKALIRDAVAHFE